MSNRDARQFSPATTLNRPGLPVGSKMPWETLGPTAGMAGFYNTMQNGGVPMQGGGMDKVTMAMMLMQAIGAGANAYVTHRQGEKDRQFARDKYNEGAEVRAEGRRRLLEAGPVDAQIPQHNLHNQTIPGTGVAAPPPPGATAQGDAELQRIVRARLGGRY